MKVEPQEDAPGSTNTIVGSRADLNLTRGQLLLMFRPEPDLQWVRWLVSLWGSFWGARLGASLRCVWCCELEDAAVKALGVIAYRVAKVGGTQQQQQQPVIEGCRIGLDFGLVWLESVVLPSRGDHGHAHGSRCSELTII